MHLAVDAGCHAHRSQGLGLGLGGGSAATQEYVSFFFPFLPPPHEWNLDLDLLARSRLAALIDVAHSGGCRWLISWG